MRRTLWLAAALCLGIGTHSLRAASPEIFYVATNGDDHWSGRLLAPNVGRTDGPFASVARARDAVRALKTVAGGLHTPVLVILRGGTYWLPETLTFTPEDSGTAQCPVSYLPAEGERVVLSGGQPISGWQKSEGKIWTAKIPQAASGQWYFHQLFVNGKRATRARSPNDGYFRSDGTLVPLVRDRKKAQPDTKIGFRFKPGDLKQWKNLDDVNVVAFHAWTASWHFIDDLDEQAHTVRFTAPSGWPMSYWEKEQRYYAENFREALDSPGEWYLDRKTGVLSYWPRPGEIFGKAEVIAPRLTTLVEFSGDPDNGKFVEHIALVRLSLQHEEWDIPRDKTADGQAAVFLGAAVSANGARHCTLERCEIAHVGQYAVNFARGCRDNLIEQCDIHDLGGGGVRLGEPARSGAMPKADNVRTCRNVVHNNFIHDGGHVFQAGIGVWVGQSPSNTISHNEVCDFYYSGMSLGWTWGYGPSEAGGNIVEFNHIHHIGQGVLSDMGGIYTLGTQTGTVLRNNVIHDVLSYSYGGWGLYTDEGSTDIVLENNVVYLTKTGGFHQHYGKNNIVRNNIFALAATEGQLIRSREEDHSSFTIERNIVYQDKGQLLGGRWNSPHYQLDHNLYWRASGEAEFAGLPLDEWRKENGHDQHSVVADPKFADAKHGDFRLKSNSPALALGFKQIDTSTVGLVGPKAWVNAPRKIKRPPTVFPPSPERKPIDDGFETTPVGQPPANAKVSGADGPGKIEVTGETAASGRRSLKITDASGTPQPWHPHFYYQPQFARGAVRVSLDLRVEKGALPVIECRDASSPYRVGPSILVDASGQLQANHKPMMPVPFGEWFHLEINFIAGRDTPGTYDLTVTLRDKKPRRFEALPFGHKDFQRLQWFGFSSMATRSVVYYVDNVKADGRGSAQRPGAAWHRPGLSATALSARCAHAGGARRLAFAEAEDGRSGSVCEGVSCGERNAALSGVAGMKVPAPRNLAASVANRLLDRSRRIGEDYQYLLVRYGLERLMYRLSQSRHADDFVVKGAMLY